MFSLIPCLLSRYLSRQTIKIKILYDCSYYVTLDDLLKDPSVTCAHNVFPKPVNCSGFACIVFASE